LLGFPEGKQQIKKQKILRKCVLQKKRLKWLQIATTLKSLNILLPWKFMADVHGKKTRSLVTL